MFIQILSIIIGTIFIIYGAYTLGADNRLNEINDLVYKAYENNLDVTFYKEKPETGVKFIPKKNNL